MYTPGEVSKILDIPPSTLRRWSAQFADHLSETGRVQGRKRMYTEADLSLFAQVKDLTARNISLDDISRRLGEIIDQGPPSEPRALALPGLTREYRRISEQLSRMEAERGEDRKRTDEDLREIRERLERLEEYYRLPWFRRLFRKPPE